MLSTRRIEMPSGGNNDYNPGEHANEENMRGWRLGVRNATLSLFAFLTWQYLL